jgi:PAS domain S-box-containing protein
MQTQEQLISALNGSGLFTWRIDILLARIEYSENVSAILGFKPANLLQQVISYFPSDERAKVIAAYRMALLKISVFHLDHNLLQPGSRSTMRFATHGSVITGQDGTIILTGTSRLIVATITEDDTLACVAAAIKEAAPEVTGHHPGLISDLRKSEEERRIAVEAGHMGTWSWNLLTNQIKCNKQHFVLLGMKPEEGYMSPNDFINHVHPNDVQFVQQQVIKSITENILFDIDFRVVRADGSTRWMSGYGQVVQTQNNKPLMMCGVTFDITNSRQLQLALEASKEQLTLLKSSATEYAIIFFDNEGIIRGWSAGAETMMGYTEDEIVGRSINLIFTAQDKEDGVPVREMQSAFIDGKASDHRWHVRKDGSQFYLDGMLFPTFTANGNVSGYVKIARDNTREEQSHEKLRQSEERNRFVLEAAGCGSWDWDIENDRLFFSDKYFELFGLEPDASQSAFMRFLPLFHPEDTENIRTSLVKSVSKGKPYRSQFRIRRADDGCLRWMNGYGSAISVNSNGEAKRMTGILFDITDIKESETALLEAEAKLKLALSAAAIGIWSHDIGTDAIEWSNEQEFIYGVPSGTFTGKLNDWKQYVHPEDTERVMRAYKEAIDGRSHLDIEYRILRADGTIRWLLVKSQTYESSYDEKEYTLGASIDITDRKLQDQLKDEFIGIASHELKTPVTSIKAYTQLLEDQFAKLGDRGNALLMRKLDNQVDRLTALINQLLDVTKIKGGKFQLDIQKFDIDGMIEEKVADIRSLTNKHTITLKTGNVSAIRGDRVRIAQVLVNLISNAIKYSPEGGEITISTMQLTQNVEVRVQDTGIGIEASLLNKVFERFFRVNDFNGGILPGLGLGLYICSQIIHRHDGVLHVESKKGSGSIFSFSIPVNGPRVD